MTSAPADPNDAVPPDPWQVITLEGAFPTKQDGKQIKRGKSAYIIRNAVPTIKNVRENVPTQ